MVGLLPPELVLQVGYAVLPHAQHLFQLLHAAFSCCGCLPLTVSRNLGHAHTSIRALLNC